MTGETNLNTLLKAMKPTLIKGDYVFCTVKNQALFESNEIILFFREEEGYTIVVKKDFADKWHLDYSFVAAWITLTVHSSLKAIGFTAAFSKALADENISCNVVAAFFHDHLFVEKKDRVKAMIILNRFSEEKNTNQ